MGWQGHKCECHRSWLHGHDLNVALRADSERNRTISERIPAVVWGTPVYGGAAVFLASSASDISRTDVNGDGGWMAR